MVSRVNSVAHAPPERVALRPSHTYRWNSTDKPGLAEFGVLARRDPRGRAVLNFEPLEPGVEFDWGDDYTPAVAALSVTVVVRLLEHTHTVGLPTPRLRALARNFGEMFLCTMPDDGGFIPIDVMEHWIHHALSRVV